VIVKTPEEEKKLIYDNDHISCYKAFVDKIHCYRHFNIGDIVVDSHNKFIITYIDEKYRLIYGRKICSTGNLSSSITHITAPYGNEFKLDEQQINAILLNEPYDPAHDAKKVAIAKRKAAYARRKLRWVRPKHYTNNQQWYAWYSAHLCINQQLWIAHTMDDRNAGDQCHTVNDISLDGIKIQPYNEPYQVVIDYSELVDFNIYLSKPPSYKEFL